MTILDMFLLIILALFCLLLTIMPVIILIYFMFGRKQNNANSSAPPQYKFYQSNQVSSESSKNDSDISFVDNQDKYISYADEYFSITHTNIREVYNDDGKFGEYLIWLGLRDLLGNRKFLFNLYIPNGDIGTTEIDVLMIHETGIYVFESKNYSGWIFGSENRIHWTQCLRCGKQTHKTQFYNPIMQNKTHIKCLKKLLNAKGTIPIHSFVVFGEKCELKKLEIQSDVHKVIKRNEMRYYVPAKINGDILSEQQINELYDFLLPYSQVSDDVKKNHIENINKNKNLNKERITCPKCGSEMSLMSENIVDDVLKQRWKCLNFKDCGHCIYYNKHADTAKKR